MVIITLLCITLCDIAADLIVVRHTMCRVDILYLFALLFFRIFFFYTQKNCPTLFLWKFKGCVQFFLLLYMHRYLSFFSFLQQNVFRLTFVSLETTSLVNLFRLDRILCLYDSKEFNLCVKNLFLETCKFFLKIYKTNLLLWVFSSRSMFYSLWLSIVAEYFSAFLKNNGEKCDINPGRVYSSVDCFLFFFKSMIVGCSLAVWMCDHSGLYTVVM